MNEKRDKWSLSAYLFDAGMPDDCFSRDEWEDRHPLVAAMVIMLPVLAFIGFIVWVNLTA